MLHRHLDGTSFPLASSQEPTSMPALSRIVVSLAVSLSLASPLAPAHAAGGGGTRPALVPANMDTTCSPCRDFYRYANGGWLQRTKVPAAFSTWGSFSELAERNRERLHALLEAARANRSA